MASGTESAPFFEQKALGILTRLENETSAEAQRIVREATELVGIFRKWSGETPTDDERVQFVQKLFILNRAALALVPESKSQASGGD